MIHFCSFEPASLWCSVTGALANTHSPSAQPLTEEEETLVSGFYPNPLGFLQRGREMGETCKAKWRTWMSQFSGLCSFLGV